MKKGVVFFIFCYATLFSQNHYLNELSFSAIHSYEEFLLLDIWSTQHKLIVAEEELALGKKRIKKLKKFLFIYKINFIQARVDTFERQLKGFNTKQNKNLKELFDEVDLFSEERIVLGEIIEQDSELSFNAQNILNQILRLITIIHRGT